MTISDSLRALNLYPINPLTAENICAECGLDGSGEIVAALRSSVAYKRAKAKVYQYLAEAPDVTEAGATYRFTDAERVSLRAKATAILAEIGEDSEGDSVGWIATDI